MSYFDVYKQRVSHLGTNYQEHAYKSGILEFRRYLKYNQHTERNLSYFEDSSPFEGVILTDKEDENRVSQILLTKVVEDDGPSLKQGDLIKWGDDTNPWIIWRSTTSSYQPHQKFYIVRCNYEIKWLDADGMLHSSWIYLVGSKDSKIKDNFRTWHSVITPQPNKYINIIMPHQLMPLGTEIMILDEVWYLVDYDQNSVPGIVFMSFTETNFNEQRDSLEDKLANADKLATWEIQMLKERDVEANSIIDLNYTILKNGVIQNVEPEISVEGNLTLLSNGKIQVGSTDGGSITVTYKGVSQKQSITIGSTPAVELMISCNEKLRVASEGNKVVVENAATDGIVEFIFEDWKDKEDKIPVPLKDLLILDSIAIDHNVCSFNVNKNNKLGKFILKIKYNNDQVLEKTIQVVSLWQVI